MYFESVPFSVILYSSHISRICCKTGSLLVTAKDFYISNLMWKVQPGSLRWNAAHSYTTVTCIHAALKVPQFWFWETYFDEVSLLEIHVI